MQKHVPSTTLAICSLRWPIDTIGHTLYTKLHLTRIITHLLTTATFPRMLHVFIVTTFPMIGFLNALCAYQVHIKPHLRKYQNCPE